MPPLYPCSASRLRNGIEDWKQITPQPLQKAVEALRRNFKEQAFKVSVIMREGCHPALHKGLAEQAREISRPMEELGYPALPTVDEGQTEPAVFSSYFYRCADLCAGALRRTFFDLRDIALAQSTLISGPPFNWAAIQAKVLVADESYGISLWLKCTCDGFESMDDDLEWKKSWRAPRWLWMRPFANSPYDRAKAWERMDEADTKHALEVMEDRFNRMLVMKLEKAVDEAHVQLAKHGVAVFSVAEPLNKAELPPEKPAKASYRASPQVSQPEPLSDLAQKGRDYLQVRNELRKIKCLARQRGLSVREIRTQDPDLLVWTFASSLSPEDRDVFEHPGTWESGYAVNVFLAKYYDKSPATMKKWVKMFRQESLHKPT